MSSEKITRREILNAINSVKEDNAEVFRTIKAIEEKIHLLDKRIVINSHDHRFSL
ncbi:MAG: hypothetical protein OXC92_10805 [Flavobacteriaceae bacterium]|nr:hypothetical protein [Flavobacteriaceae bacterium]MCY4217453.1 hypothetical protein [Flavobacteriaceae bacterium]MCY4254230.1 hypothetical protein [Flavobacteriaceae bacterium]